jgi:hypothetical protein
MWRLFILAFPLDRSPVGEWLVTVAAPILGSLSPTEPDDPNSKIAVLREGALLYEIHGEPYSDKRL